MLDSEVYMATLLAQSFAALELDPEPSVTPDVDVDQLDALPAITWHLTGGGQQSNGPGLRSYSLNVDIFGDGMDQAKAVMLALDDIVHGWGDNGATTELAIGDHIGRVAIVDDNDLPSRIPAAVIDGRHVVQYSGAYALWIRQL